MREILRKFQMDLERLKRMDLYAAVNYIRRGMGYDEYLVRTAAEKGTDKNELLKEAEWFQKQVRQFRSLEQLKEHIALYEKELEKAQEEIEEQKDKYLRLSAEFDNYRKRTMKEKAELILNGGEKSLSSILPVVDDFERAIKTMETATDVNAVKEGVELIYNKFMAVLAQNGVKVIETKDQPLDTDYHEAIAVIPAPSEAQKGKILDCVQTGYTLNDKVLRHAKVVVGE